MVSKNLIRLLVAAVLFALFTWAIKREGPLSEPGYKPPPKYPEPTKKWVLEIPKNVRYAPAVADDGTIYIGSPEGLLAIAPEGAIRWMFSDTVVSGAAPIRIDGTAALSVREHGVRFGPPSIDADGRIYSNSSNGQIYLVDRAGNLVFKAPTGAYVGEAPITIGTTGYLYMGNSNGSIESRRALDGELMWQYGAKIRGFNPVMGPDYRIVAGGTGGVAKLEQGGEVFFELQPREYANCKSAAVASTNVIYVGCDRMFLQVDGFGQIKAQYDTGTPNMGQPVIAADGSVYLVGNGMLRAFTPELQQKWAFQLDGASSSSPALGADGTIYIGGYDNRVFAFKPNGEIRWQLSIAGTAASPAIAPDGTVYVVSSEGKLYAIADNNGGLMNSDWPKFQHDARNTGAAVK